MRSQPDYFDVVLFSFLLLFLSLREAFIRKNLKYIGLLPIRGGRAGVPPDKYIYVFLLKKTFIA